MARHHEKAKSKGFTVIFTDAACNSNKSCLAGIVKNDQGVRLSWFQCCVSGSLLHKQRLLLLNPNDGETYRFVLIVWWR